MKKGNSMGERRAEFARNDSLEGLLNELNQSLAHAERDALARYAECHPRYPFVFIMGAARCGSTLFLQWLANTDSFAYPTNLLSRFWAAPIVGARIQKLLTDPAYDFRQELYDLKKEINFTSNHGKTTGALSPNEFWYFWRRFFPGDDYHPRAALEKNVDSQTLRAELVGITDVFDKPFVAKGMIFNENIPYVADILPRSIFVWIKRRPVYNIQSLLLARQRQYGDIAQWYSFRIRDYEQLKGLDPVESVAGQVASIHQSLQSGISSLPKERVLEVSYESFCENPSVVYSSLLERMLHYNMTLPAYSGPHKFTPREEWNLDWISIDRVQDIYKKMSKRFGVSH